MELENKQNNIFYLQNLQYQMKSFKNLQFYVDHPVCGGKNNYCNKIADEMMMRKKVRGTA